MFRFAIRDVLLLTALVALGVAWWIDHREVTRRGDARAAAIQDAADLAAKANQTEILDWKFRAKSLESNLKSSWKADVTYQEGAAGQEQVVVKWEKGKSMCQDNRAIHAKLKADWEAARRKTGL